MEAMDPGDKVNSGSSEGALRASEERFSS